MIDWRTISKEDFERTAEVLIRRSQTEDNPGLDVKALDGRGGDDGIDLDVRVKKTDQLVSIYQLKWFPEGFSGGFSKTRRAQIKSSYISALKHNPPVWYLVVPRNATPKERSYLRSLRGKKGGPTIRYIGATELDELLMRYPAVEEWAQREPFRSALETFGRTTAALSQPGDLGHEVMDLARRIQPRSDYWNVNFAFENGQYVEEFVPLRPDSFEREPLGVKFTTDFTDNEDLQRTFEKARRYGASEPIVFPEGVIQNFERHGPEWFAGKEDVGSLELHPILEDLGEAMALSLLADDGRQIARRTAVAARMTRGTNGGRFLLDLGDGLAFSFRLDVDSRADGEMTAAYELDGVSGATAKRALKFMTSVSRASRLKLELDGRSLTMIVDTSGLRPNPFAVELADDLAFIEDELNVNLKYAYEDGALVDRIWVRVVRRVLEGGVSLLPATRGMDIFLEGSLDDALEHLLRKGGGFSTTTKLWQTTLLGEPIEIDDVSVLIPDAVAENGEEHLAALRAGKGKGRKVTVIPRDENFGLLMWSTSRLEGRDTLAPDQWGLTGVKEHLQLRKDR